MLVPHSPNPISSDSCAFPIAELKSHLQLTSWTKAPWRGKHYPSLQSENLSICSHTWSTLAQNIAPPSCNVELLMRNLISTWALFLYTMTRFSFTEDFMSIPSSLMYYNLIRILCIMYREGFFLKKKLYIFYSSVKLNCFCHLQIFSLHVDTNYY